MAAMDGYKARKAPNVSHYLANLNTLPSAHDLAIQQDEFNIEDELAQFTNTDFLDYDAEGLMEPPMPEYDPSREEKARRENAAANNKISGKGLELVTGEYHYSGMEFPPSPPSAINPPIQTHYLSNGLQPAIYPTSNTPPMTYDHQAFNPLPYPGQKHHLSPITTHASQTPSTTNTATSNPSNEPESPAARLAAEEDKRRRNTAASARFRVKKKQREQALEQTAKELESKNGQLEQRIAQLETENEWLRGIVVEKNGGAKEDLRVRWEQYGGPAGRKGSKAKKGVGTGDDEGGERE